MTQFRATLGTQTFRFDTLAQVMACATPARSGDHLAGIAAQTDVQRVAAQCVLADLPLKTFLDQPLVPYEADEVTRLICDSHDAGAFAAVSSMTVGAFREWLLSEAADGAALAALAPGLTPEMVAAVSKIMRNRDLISVAKKVQVVTGFRNTIGLPGRIGSRLQPNHPADDISRHHGQHDRWAVLWGGRRGDRDQPGHGQHPHRQGTAAGAGRFSRPL
jgi:ethanolamine ammonia-lyase large subunit